MSTTAPGDDEMLTSEELSELLAELPIILAALMTEQEDL